MQPPFGLRGEEGSHRGRRILVVGDVFPWPPRDGYRLRVSGVLDGLGAAGDVDLFIAAQPGEDEDVVPPAYVGRHDIVAAPPTPRSIGLALRTVGSRLPRRVLWRDWSDARSRLARFASGPYDVVWYSHADTFAALGDPALGPAIVDLDNLEDVILGGSSLWRSMGKLLRPGSAPGSGGKRRFATSLLDVRDAWCWLRVQRRQATVAEAVVVCSEVDRQRLGSSNSVVVPNAYADPGPPPDTVPTSPTLVMVAHFVYQPNLDAAAWLVRDVLPMVRRLIPEVQVRLVGHHDHRLPAVAAASGVTIVGRVADVGAELRGARAAIVPVLSGSGTRIKVLEALAYGLPMVTTSIGCEGIAIEPGRHALVCDEPGDFADACHRVLVDDELWRRLRSAGRTLYLDRYAWDQLAGRVRDLAGSVIERRSAVRTS